MNDTEKPKVIKKIGTGSFTRAYLLDNGRVRIISTDPIKECMAIGWFPDSRLFPEIERTNYGLGRDGDASEYEMEFYSKTRSLKNTLCERDYRLYKELRSCLQSITYKTNRAYNQDALHEAFDGLSSEFKEEKESLKEATDACLNYGPDVAFEISPRNVAVKDGKLVLLDCFFMQSALDKR